MTSKDLSCQKESKKKDTAGGCTTECVESSVNNHINRSPLIAVKLASESEGTVLKLLIWYKTSFLIHHHQQTFSYWPQSSPQQAIDYCIKASGK